MTRFHNDGQHIHVTNNKIEGCTHDGDLRPNQYDGVSEHARAHQEYMHEVARDKAKLLEAARLPGETFTRWPPQTPNTATGISNGFFVEENKELTREEWAKLLPGTFKEIDNMKIFEYVAVVWNLDHGQRSDIALIALGTVAAGGYHEALVAATQSCGLTAGVGQKLEILVRDWER